MTPDDKVKKQKEAAALSYDLNEAAPRVVAAGKGHIADKIVEKAQESGIPVYEDPGLAHTLNMLGIGDQIPPELYTLVAQILVYVRDVDNRAVAPERMKGVPL